MAFVLFFFFIAFWILPFPHCLAKVLASDVTDGHSLTSCSYPPRCSRNLLLAPFRTILQYLHIMLLLFLTDFAINQQYLCHSFWILGLYNAFKDSNSCKVWFILKKYTDFKKKYTDFFFRQFSFGMSFGIVNWSVKTFLRRTQDVVYFASYKTKIYGIFRICPYIRIFFRICTTMTGTTAVSKHKSARQTKKNENLFGKKKLLR